MRGELRGVMDAFATLGMMPRLVISEEELRGVFRDAGKRAHPDAGGGEGEFAELREAMAILSSPSRRLRHWLELKGGVVETRGTIGPGLMDLFGIVGEATRKAEMAIRKREEARSALAKALLETEAQGARELLEEATGKVDRAIDMECGVFRILERGETEGIEDVSRTVRDLAFLEKWKAGLRSCYSRLA